MVSAIIGIIPIEIVQQLTHTYGNVAVGHAVGSGVRQIETKSETPLQRIQLRCLLLGNNRFINKLLLEELYNTKKAIPFISFIASLPKVLIDNLSFTATSSKKDLDGSSVIEFVITLVELRVKKFYKLATKFAWLLWTYSTYPDVSTKAKLYPTAPSAEQESSLIVSEYIYANAINELSNSDFENRSQPYTDDELISLNNLNKKFSKIPVNENGVFPQTIKLQYPPSPTYYTDFNIESNLPDDYTNYIFPVYNELQNNVIIIKIIPKMIDSNIYITIVLIVNDDIIFERKINSGIIYNIGDYQLTFNKIDIKEENIQPINQEGGSYGSIFEGGIRLK